MNEPAHNSQARLASGRLLARNTIWNLLGNGAPMLVAVLCIPILIRELGKDRFGVLTLAWALIGYANLFDLGLGRALTQVVARKIGEGNDHDIPFVAWTSLGLMLALGIVASTLIMVLAPLLVVYGLKVQLPLQHEAVWAFRVLGISLPFAITSAGLRGLLEAHQRFRLTNALRIPMGVLTFLGPLVVLPFSRSLVPLVGSLVVSRVIIWSAYLLSCLRLVPNLRHNFTWDRASVGPLLRFGGWMTISNIVSPLLVTLDRFLIGALVSMTAVAYYATPWEVATKLLLVPSALMGVLFPAFSAGYTQDRERTSRLFCRSLKLLFMILFPAMLCAIIFAPDILRLWLGAEFAEHSYRVFQCLAIGVFINSLSLVPYTFVQGVGRPDISAKLHLIELPLYVALLWFMIGSYGIVGAAIAWSVRISFDAASLFLLSWGFLFRGGVRIRMCLLPMAALLTLIVAAGLEGSLIKGVFLVACTACSGAFMWFRVLTPAERALAQNYF